MVKFTNNFNSFKRQLLNNNKQALEEIGKFSKSKMDKHAPKDTGFLMSRNSYQVSDRLVILLNDCPYGGHQEFGTLYQSGTPFMRPAAFNYVSNLNSILVNNLRKGL